jgi:hypothetical protein
MDQRRNGISSAFADRPREANAAGADAAGEIKQAISSSTAAIQPSVAPSVEDRAAS